jgi:hypothetical protein
VTLADRAGRLPDRLRRLLDVDHVRFFFRLPFLVVVVLLALALLHR